MQHLHLQLREVHEDSDHYFADSTVITRKYLTGPNRAHQSTRKYCICQRQVYQLRGQTTSQGRYSGWMIRIERPFFARYLLAHRPSALTDWR